MGFFSTRPLLLDLRKYSYQRNLLAFDVIDKAVSRFRGYSNLEELENVSKSGAPGAGAARKLRADHAVTKSDVEQANVPPMELVQAKTGMGRFALKFAPHLGIVPGGAGLFAESAGPDAADQVRFCHDNGFEAIEDNFLQNRSPAVQKQIGRVLSERNMTMGCFLGVTVFDRPTFGLADADMAALLHSELTRALAAADRVNGRYLTVIPGWADPNADRGTQLRNVVQNFQKLAPIAEAAGVVLLVEAISRKRWQDVLVSDVKDARAVCEAVGSPSVKVLFDVYQCQCESGDLIDNMDTCWDQIGCIQIADNPGRSEPGTGEINFGNVLAHIKRRGWTGLVEMEHGLVRLGATAEKNVINIYQELSDSVVNATRA